MQNDWVESVEIYGERGAQAIAQARADAEWQGWIEEVER